MLALSLSLKSESEVTGNCDTNSDSKASIENEITQQSASSIPDCNNDDITNISTNNIIDTTDDELIYGSIENISANDIGNSDSDSNNNDRSHDLLSKIDRILAANIPENLAIESDDIESDDIERDNIVSDNSGCEHFETVNDNSINDINDIIINEILTNDNNSGVDSNSATNTNDDILL